MADDKSTEQVQDLGAQTKTYTHEQYSKLQTELNKSRSAVKEAMLSRVDVDEVKQNQAFITELLTQLVEKGLGADDEELKGLSAQRKGITTANQARRELTGLLQEADVAWDDERPEMAEVRKAYESGNYESALATARKLNGQSKASDIDALVEAKVQKILGERAKVDKGETKGGSGVPTDLEELKSKLMDRAWRKEHMKEVLDAARRGLIKGVAPGV